MILNPVQQVQLFFYTGWAVLTLKSYIWGEENCDMPVLDSLGFVQKIMIHKSGHGMMTDNPEEYFSSLVNFINSKNRSSFFYVFKGNTL